MDVSVFGTEDSIIMTITNKENKDNNAMEKYT